MEEEHEDVVDEEAIAAEEEVADAAGASKTLSTAG